MLKDVFNEQLVKRATTPLDVFLRVLLLLVLLVVSVVAFWFIPAFALMVVVAAAFGAWWLNGRLNKEFEYALTNNDLDVDVIYNRAARKRIFSGDIKAFEMMAPVTDTSREVEAAFARAQATLDCSRGRPGENTYAFITHYNSKRIKVIFDPNDAMLALMAKRLTPQKFYAKK